MYDNQIGRWTAIDPLSDSYYDLSNYHTSGNNPVLYVDHEGRFFGTLIGGLIGGIVGGVQAAIHHENVWKGIGKGALSGAVAGAIIDLTVATAGTGTLTLALTVGGTLSGAAGNAVDQGLNILDDTQSKFSTARLLGSAALGGAFGYAGAKIGGYLSETIAGPDAAAGAIVGGANRTGSVVIGELETTIVGEEITGSVGANINSSGKLLQAGG